MGSWHLGTMGFSYKDWSGVFYPAGMPSRNYLAHYSRVFDAVELDSTFYGTPRRMQVERWAAVTPPDFVFCAKTPRAVTHELGPTSPRAMDVMREFVSALRLLGGKLGAILIQFPPSFPATEAAHLATFLTRLPADVRYAVEFRHRSWYTAATAEMLEPLSVCWATTDFVGLPQQVNKSADFLYVRWIGQHGTYRHHDREQADVSDQLVWWWEQLRPCAQRVDSVYGFFNNDYAGHAPATCETFRRLGGLAGDDDQPPLQTRLF